ncbi:uncharacterized protein MICPUCDRAFT_56196 [Micromonas pusilla CCMP1545]|uniref:Predicted protein n=1 Tax=Micromonas pusilla (strain CCMP1545) TaxID=564608 RepID=C1MP98_MICPC|nr:uncharacterized protein MICPUCDRAFT_56196 [Micromonas pusilla CCMP1545]EEH58428.1 predicted protein [Micromonas pusilla CCMP1545]|eukprot:XP_003056783.1 predicted protein [Micromonas pusilla CCMP1545]
MARHRRVLGRRAPRPGSASVACPRRSTTPRYRVRASCSTERRALSVRSAHRLLSAASDERTLVAWCPSFSAPVFGCLR